MNDKKCSPKSGEDCWVEPRLLIMKMAVQGNERKARKPEGERTRQTAKKPEDEGTRRKPRKPESEGARRKPRKPEGEEEGRSKEA